MCACACTIKQGGGVAAAFTAHFPHLVDEKVVLIASAGLIEVRHVSFARPVGEACGSDKPPITRTRISHVQRNSCRHLWFKLLLQACPSEYVFFPNPAVFGAYSRVLEIPATLDKFKFEGWG